MGRASRKPHWPGGGGRRSLALCRGRGGVCFSQDCSSVVGRGSVTAHVTGAACGSLTGRLPSATEGSADCGHRKYFQFRGPRSGRDDSTVCAVKVARVPHTGGRAGARGPAAPAAPRSGWTRRTPARPPGTGAAVLHRHVAPAPRPRSAAGGARGGGQSKEAASARVSGRVPPGVPSPA